MPRKYFDLTRLPARPVLRAAGNLPAAFDFREDFGPVVTQNDPATGAGVGDCTGCSEAGMMQALIVEAGRPAVTLDIPELYYEERLAEGNPTQDTGANPVDGLKWLQRVGIAPSSDGPAPWVLETLPPSLQVLRDSAPNRIASFAAIALTDDPDPAKAIVPLLQVLAQRIPVEIAVAVHQSFEQASDGNIPMPGATSVDPMMGGHAIVLCGYKIDASQPGGGVVNFRNSWTAQWGQQGYGTLPFAYVADPGLCYGLWYATLLPEAQAGPQPLTLPVYVNGKEAAGVLAFTDLVEGYVFAPAVEIGQALGYAATRDAKGVYYGAAAPKRKASIWKRLFGRV